MKYPPVMTEDATLDLVLGGRSLARVGDGEIKLALGGGIKAQGFDRALQSVLLEVCAAGDGNDGPCLAAIPNVAGAHHRMPAARVGYVAFCTMPRAAGLYGRGPYGSSLITRPDCAPHIDRPDYWAKLAGLWAGRDVVLVYGSGKGLTPRDLEAAASVEAVFLGPVEAWAEAPAAVRRLKRETRRVLLCLGATATAMAWQLAEHGVHAVDLGGVGRFLRRALAREVPDNGCAVSGMRAPDGRADGGFA